MLGPHAGKHSHQRLTDGKRSRLRSRRRPNPALALPASGRHLDAAASQLGGRRDAAASGVAAGHTLGPNLLLEGIITGLKFF